MDIVSAKHLNDFMDLFHQDNDEIYQRIGKGFNSIAYISNSFAGIIFKVNDDKKFTSEIYEVNDEEICKIFKEYSLRESFVCTSELKTYIEFNDARGFVSDGYYIFKGVEDFKWNRYSSKKDLKELNDAILRAGAKHQDICNNFNEFGFNSNFDGEILASISHGGYIARISHRGEERFVVFNSEGKCYDIYPDNPELIKWEKYDLDKRKKLAS